MELRNKITFIHSRILEIIILLNFFIIPFILSFTSLNISSDSSYRSYICTDLRWLFLGIGSLLSIPLSAFKKDSYSFFMLLWDLLKTVCFSYFTFSLILKKPLFKESIVTGYVKEYLDFADPFLNMASEQAAFKNSLTLANIFYFMLCLTIICFLISHIIEFILLFTNRE